MNSFSMNIVSAATFIFWTSFSFVAYTFVGYPLLVAALSRLRPRAIRRSAPDDEYSPRVSMIIAARNEERDLPAKFQNITELDYPRDRLEVIVVSDNSTDRTDDIAREWAANAPHDLKVRVLRQPERLGKTAAQNAAVEISDGEILLFSDATTLYRPDVLRAILPNFFDASVGCVAGRLIYVDPASSNVGSGARSYWGYETFLKRCESRIGSLIGTSGCLYAVRRANYVALPHEAGSDFVIATVMAEQGLRTIYEPDAICTEETNRRARPEFQMRVRVMTQTFADLWRHRAMLHPLRSGFYAVQLLSHKVLRYLVPFFLLTIFAASTLLAPKSVFYFIFFMAQGGFYLLAALGWLLERAGARNKLLALPYYFVLANLASLVALTQFARGERYQRWETVRESRSESPAECA
jgi:cellulose synthase/poly-beta-1,6-N-acetylglucosamine synthase-like glycosyltransferase